jgi:hypothetical protein
MRSLVLAVALALCAPSPAAADYRRLPGPPVDAGFVLQGSRVLVGAAGVLTAHAPDGTTRVVRLPKTSGKLRWVRASEQALSVEMSNTEYAALNGGRWRKLGGARVTGNVAGPKALVLTRNEFDEHGALDVIDLRTGARRHLRIPENRPVGATIVGDYLAYIVYFATSGKETLIVRRVSTGREVFRRRIGTISDFALLPGGHLVIVTPGSYEGAYRIATEKRTIREVALLSSQVVATSSGIAIVRRDAQFRGDVWLLGYDGKMRPLTPLLPEMDRIVFDGRRLAFGVGTCVFAGLIPAPGAPLPPVAPERCVRS